MAGLHSPPEHEVGKRRRVYFPHTPDRATIIAHPQRIPTRLPAPASRCLFSWEHCRE